MTKLQNPLHVKMLQDIVAQDKEIHSQYIRKVEKIKVEKVDMVEEMNS